MNVRESLVRELQENVGIAEELNAANLSVTETVVDASAATRGALSIGGDFQRITLLIRWIKVQVADRVWDGVAAIQGSHLTRFATTMPVHDINLSGPGWSIEAGATSEPVFAQEIGDAVAYPNTLVLYTRLRLATSHTRPQTLYLVLYLTCTVRNQHLQFMLGKSPLFLDQDLKRLALLRRLPARDRINIMATLVSDVVSSLQEFDADLAALESNDLAGLKFRDGYCVGPALYVVSKKERRDFVRSNVPRLSTQVMPESGVLYLHRARVESLIRIVASSYNAAPFEFRFARGFVDVGLIRHDSHHKTIFGPWDVDVYVTTTLWYSFRLRTVGTSRLAINGTLFDGNISVRVEDAPTRGAARKAVRKAMEIAKQKVEENRNIYRGLGSLDDSVVLSEPRFMSEGMLIYVTKREV